jgi:hypothetical protein
VRLLRPGEQEGREEPRPDARLLQDGLTQRLGGAAADPAPVPARRAAGSPRRVLNRLKFNESRDGAARPGAQRSQADGCA